MTHKMIYPETLAEMLKSRAGEKYRPSNGTEGDYFFAAWCSDCKREQCAIITNSMSYDIDDQDYPRELQIDKDGQPCCTAFVEHDEAGDGGAGGAA